MKKIISFLLAAVLLVSAVPMAYAAETTDYTNGTAVTYTATGTEEWTVTVPAQLAPGGSGTVTLEGTWASDRVVSVTADKNVVLTNSIKAADQKTLNVSFPGIDEYGSNTTSQTFTETVSVAGISDALFGTWSGRFYYNVDIYDAVEYLQSKYAFDYYSTMNLAVTDVNNGAIGASADSDKADAVAGIYTDENGGVNVVLLQDTTETSRLTASADMTINLGGNVLTFDNTGVGIDTVQDNGNTITIDGRLKGSTVYAIGQGKAIRVTQCRSGNTLNINGGTYIATSDSHSCLGLYYSSSTSAQGTLTNCSVKAYSNYTSSTGNSYSTKGISNGGTLTLNDCYVMGIHSGVSSNGTLYVNGGTYEGYGHGGFYFSGAGTTSYVRNATIRECEMPTGYYADIDATTNSAGVYIGGNIGMDNISVYMDNCNISAAWQPIVLRGTSGEQNNSLYISNSTITRHSVHPGGEWDIRIDNDTHRLYIGQNCNFDISDCAPLPSQPQFDMSTVVFETDEVYIMN